MRNQRAVASLLLLFCLIAVAVEGAVTPQADLSITKTDGQTSVSPGQSVTYTIVVTNTGPSAASGATVTDLFPATLTGVAFTSAAAGGATGNTTTGSGSINDTVNLPAGSSITYTATGTLDPAATGTLSNTATVTAPASVTDPNPGNNSATDIDTIPQADLQITKTDGQTTVTPGQSVTYTIVVSNAGPDTANGAAVSDVFPAEISGVTFTSIAAGGATGNTASGSGSINDTINLPSGGSITYTATGTLSASASGTLTNTATITPPASVPDPTPANNSATDVDAIAPQADLQITKTDGQVDVVPGQVITYTIVVANAGPSAANGAQVSDPVLFLPLSGVTFTSSAAGGATGNTASGSGSISDTVNLPAGSSITYQLSGTVNASTGFFINTATVASPVTDLNPGNNSASDEDTITPSVVLQADLQITKTDGQTTVLPGQSVTYTIVVTNAGPNDANGAQVTDTFLFEPLSGITFTSSAAGGATGNTASGSGDINDIVNLPVGSSITYTVTGTLSATATGMLSNSATAAPPVTVFDGNTGNNSATDTDTIITPALPPADLQITKSDGQATAVPGQPVTYTIVVTNAGPTDANGAQVSDAFLFEPLTGVTFTSSAAGAATGNTASGSGDINDIVNLPVGSSITYTVTGTLSPGATGTLTNQATVNGAGVVTDSNAANNSATDTDVLTPQADLQITKIDSPDPVNPGGTITYTITTSNNGPSDAQFASLIDTLPFGTTFSSLTQNSGPTFSCTPPAVGTNGTVTCTTASLANGNSATFTLVVNVPAATAAGTTISNTASIGSTTTDNNAGNNTSTSTTAVVASLAVPALDDFGLALLALSLAIGGALAVRRG